MNEIWKIWTELKNVEKYGKYRLITHYRSYKHILTKLGNKYGNPYKSVPYLLHTLGI